MMRVDSHVHHVAVLRIPTPGRYTWSTLRKLLCQLECLHGWEHGA